jgi:hypothetical protein
MSTRLSPVLLFLCVALAAARLHFDSRAEAVAYVTAYARRFPALRLALSHGVAGSAALSEREMDALLVERLHLVSSTAALAAGNAHDEDDVRQRFMTRAWMPDALITYAHETASRTSPATLATLASVRATDTTEQPPVEVRDVMAALLVYATMLSDDNRCPSVSDVPVGNAATGEMSCECADGHACASGSALTMSTVVSADTLPGAVLIVALVVMGVVLLGLAVPNVLLMRRIFRERHDADNDSTAELQTILRL